MPPLDTIKNTIDIATGIGKKTTSDNKILASFEAVFDRPCNSGDIQDSPLVVSSVNQMIWAYGQLSNAEPTVHGTTSKDRGAGTIFFLNLPN